LPAHRLLSQALSKRRIGGAALDVFDVGPLPAGHPIRALDNVVTTPDVGYVIRNLYHTFDGHTVANIAKWLDSRS
jgi:phosphoglycerate dehydrogenase-like enzyme